MLRSKVLDGVLRQEDTLAQGSSLEAEGKPVDWKQMASFALCNDFGRSIEDRGQAELRALRSEDSCAPCIEIRGHSA